MTICTPSKCQTLNCADKFILVELSKLIVFGYDLDDTQDGVRCWRIGIYILWLTSSPFDKNSSERSRAHGPFCFKNFFQELSEFQTVWIQIGTNILSILLGPNCLQRLTSSPCDKNSGERSRVHGPSCFKNFFQEHY